jgi:hypothetical protein
VYYFTRLAVVLKSWDFWAAILLPEADWYLFFSGLIWGILFLISTAGLWLGWAVARKGLLLLAPLYTGYLWLERFVLSQINNSSPGWPFFLVVTFLALAWTIWVLQRKVVKQFFGENIYEQRPQN